MFDFLKKIHPSKSKKKYKIDIDLKNTIKDINIINNPNNYYFHSTSDIETIESMKKYDIVDDLKIKVIKLEEDLSKGRTRIALEGYLEIKENSNYQKFHKDFKFKILLGILNASINLNFDENEIKNSIYGIKALGEDINDIHKLYFLQGIMEYKKRKFENALLFVNKSLEVKSDYIKSMAFKVLIRHLLKRD